MLMSARSRSPTTVIAVVKKSRRAATRQPALLLALCSRPAHVPAGRAAELDEMWSFVGAKKRARWLACDQSSHRESIGLCGGHPERCGLPETPGLVSPFRHHAFLHRHGNCLSASAPARTTLDREIVEAKDRAQAPHVANASEALDPHDTGLLPLTVSLGEF